MKKITRLHESDIRRIVKGVVARILKESYQAIDIEVRTYGLNPIQKEAAEALVRKNKRVVGNYTLKDASEYAKGWSENSDDKEERIFIKKALQDGLDIYELVDDWQAIGLVAF